jgi:cellulose synthase/poly-beta-1,6-N-acetylglucosamine synthase-like glycosyltransferase
MTIASIIFFVSLLGLIWIYVGYMSFLLIATIIKKKRSKTDQSIRPTVSIMIMTFNEEDVIRKKIENTLALDYPRENIEIIVVDSNSSDKTQGIVREFESKGVKLIVQEKREGKASAIHYGMKQATGEIAISTDANAYYASDVIKKIVPHFADEKVGGVTGAMMQVDKSKTNISKGGDMYWKMEKLMRTNESKLHSVIGMSGEICCFRRNLFEDTQLKDWYNKGENDDFSLSYYIIKKGYKVAYAPDAYVWEAAPDNIGDLFKQKVRIITMTIKTMIMRPSMIGFKHGIYSAVILPSRKILPLYSPVFLVALIITNFILIEQGQIYYYIFIAQVLMYVLAVLGFVSILKKILPINIANYFVLLNLTIIFGWISFLIGKDFTIWEKVSSTRN